VRTFTFNQDQQEEDTFNLITKYADIYGKTVIYHRSLNRVQNKRCTSGFRSQNGKQKKQKIKKTRKNGQPGSAT